MPFASQKRVLSRMKKGGDVREGGYLKERVLFS